MCTLKSKLISINILLLTLQCTESILFLFNHKNITTSKFQPAGWPAKKSHFQQKQEFDRLNGSPLYIHPWHILLYLLTLGLGVVMSSLGLHNEIKPTMKSNLNHVNYDFINMLDPLWHFLENQKLFGAYKNGTGYCLDLFTQPISFHVNSSHLSHD